MVLLQRDFLLLMTNCCEAGRYLPALFLVIGNSDQRESL
jgi:hypothetical protein